MLLVARCAQAGDGVGVHAPWRCDSPHRSASHLTLCQDLGRYPSARERSSPSRCS